MPRKGYMYDYPFPKNNFEYYCGKCKRIIVSIDDRHTRHTCACCGSVDIVKGDIGTLKVVFKEDSCQQNT